MTGGPNQQKHQTMKQTRKTISTCKFFSTFLKVKLLRTWRIREIVVLLLSVGTFSPSSTYYRVQPRPFSAWRTPSFLPSLLPFSFRKKKVEGG